MASRAPSASIYVLSPSVVRDVCTFTHRTSICQTLERGQPALSVDFPLAVVVAFTLLPAARSFLKIGYRMSTFLLYRVWVEAMQSDTARRFRVCAWQRRTCFCRFCVAVSPIMWVLCTLRLQRLYIVSVNSSVNLSIDRWFLECSEWMCWQASKRRAWR